MAVDADLVRDAVGGWLTDARGAWPGIAVDDTTFAAYVTARLRSADDLAVIHASDLYLTAACVAGDPTALVAFERGYLSPLDGVLGPTGLTSEEINDVRQELMRKLLVADGGPPRLSEYSGRADLRTWVRTAAVRTGIDLLRRRKPMSNDDEQLAALPSIADDPELLHLKNRYQGELREALMSCLSDLDARDKLLLKYAYLDDLSVERIGALYGVHKSTAARWVAAARDRLSEHAYQRLVTHLGITRSELRSIARLVESQLELSLRRLLG